AFPGDVRYWTANVARKPDVRFVACTERALDAALSDAADGTLLVFNCSATISITSTKTIERRITLDSVGQSVTLRGKSVLFKIAKQGALTLYHLTVSGDQRDAIGVLNNGVLLINESRIEESSTGLINYGQARIVRSVFTGNRLAAIYNSGLLDL